MVAAMKSFFVLGVERRSDNEWVGIGRAILPQNVTIRIVFDLEEDAAKQLREKLLVGDVVFESVPDGNIISVLREGDAEGNPE